MNDADAASRRETTVVVVDDHPMVAETLMTLVRGIDGFSPVAWASTAGEGLAAVLTHQPDVVVLDYHLPDEHGGNLARRIRKVAPATKVVMLTGAQDPRSVVEALEAGCDGFIEKTHAPTELVRVLKSVVAGAREFPSDLLAELPRMEDLVVHYQPIVDLESEAVVGAEALVTWNHPLRGLLAPDAFIPRAEETGLIVPLGWRVLQEACEQASRWRRELPEAMGLSVSVNASAQQLERFDFVERVAEALRAADLPADRLVIELTETGVMDGDQRTAEQLCAARTLGVELRVDDFGTGHSSLVNLRRFPIGALKIDRSFISGMLSHAEDMEIVAASIRLAQSLGMRSVAEGVENDAQSEKLRELGCALAQGYLWSRPLPPDAFGEWYRRRFDAHRGDSVRGMEGESAHGAPTNAPPRFRYEHCGWCHLKGAYLVPDRLVLRCKYCQAVTAIAAEDRREVEGDLASRCRNLRGLRTTKRDSGMRCPECDLPGGTPKVI